MSFYKHVYSPKLIELFKNPKNVGEMPDADVKVTEGSLACGDMITLFLKVDEKTKRIEDIKFLSYGCAANIATTSIMTELVKGKTLEEAKKITFKEIAEALGGLPPVKMHCAVLSIDGLRSAIRKYEEERGLIEVPELDESFIRSRLRRIMNPKLGRDIVSTGIVEKIRIQEEKVEIDINMSEEDEFAGYIREEIRERLERLPNIKELKIKFEGE
ncbi:TPA: iron-sulfur cluster assembly scaffold protein [Candidatus Bathyarchaeota archaeon]|nr:iron-sulfur cluster assembly scaffold protein [Candidatus Bathyarchaeota archaeon]